VKSKMIVDVVREVYRLYARGKIDIVNPRLIEEMARSVSTELVGLKWVCSFITVCEGFRGLATGDLSCLEDLHIFYDKGARRLYEVTVTWYTWRSKHGKRNVRISNMSFREHNIDSMREVLKKTYKHPEAVEELTDEEVVMECVLKQRVCDVVCLES